MYIYIYLFNYLFIYLSIYLFIYVYIYICVCVCAKTIITSRERERNRQRKKESKQATKEERDKERERERVLPTTRYTVYSTRNNEVETGQFYPFAPQNYTVLPDITSVFNNPRLCWVPVGSMWIFKPVTPSASKQRPSGFSTSAAEVKSWQTIQQTGSGTWGHVKGRGV